MEVLYRLLQLLCLGTIACTYACNGEIYISGEPERAPHRRVCCGISLYILDECMTLWGEPERVYVQNVEQLHVSSECN